MSLKHTINPQKTNLSCIDTGRINIDIDMVNALATALGLELTLVSVEYCSNKK